MKSRRETLEEFISQDPNDSFSRYALALELDKAGEPTEAAKHLAEVIARDPEYLGAYYQLGRLLARAGDVEQARSIYTRGLATATAGHDRRTASEIREALESL